ncbi:LytTR family DNA-binding domain-containing protein [Guyparkeria hydrothermalis]|uniref:LytR/AlgR family response regulator transcription factor n=1 Tax=Guyparkeria hydrothermalis TaxID=923 RepID=UPI002022641D|nr:LytTR family DNA-binding domain-containing protein [Guyparkeria hydrothermalis]MCL7744997.1 LytTR family DNA-binding domain-containing protein [Guyparkeria hydrothermalis]
MMRALIVDDEPLARGRLRRLLVGLGGVEVVGEAANADEACEAMRTVPDLVFLDIEMPGEDGIRLGHRLREADLPPAIIYTTAHADRALIASETAPAGYLLKPVEPDALRAAIDRAAQPTRCQQARRPTLPVRLGREELCLGAEHLVAALAEDKATQLHFLDPADGRRREAWIETSLNELEARFDGRLLRLHRNSLANPRQIVSVTHEGGLHHCHLRHLDEPLAISRRAWRTVRAALDHGE